MSTLDVLLTVTTISGWLAFGAAYQHVRTVRAELRAALIREQALIQAQKDGLR